MFGDLTMVPHWKGASAPFFMFNKENVMSSDWKFSYEGYNEKENPEVPTIIETETGKTFFPIKYNLQKPVDASGNFRDQTGQAAANMRYAATLGLPELGFRPTPRFGRAIICGGAPSIKNHLEEIRALAADPDNWIFAINWTHTWLIQNGIVPKGCVFFEIDAEPGTVLKAAHPDCTYFICCHCENITFDALKDFKRVLWHTPPNSDAERLVHEELFKDSYLIGGGVGTFTRTMTIAITMGFRGLEIFGVDGSFPDASKSTHVEGYETVNDVRTDSFEVIAQSTGDASIMRKFRTVGYLALQVDEFQEYCRINHQHFACRIHGDSLMRFAHENFFPAQYDYRKNV